MENYKTQLTQVMIMISQEDKDNDVNGTGPDNWEGVAPGREDVREQAPPGRQQTTARRKFAKHANKIVMECYFRE